MNWSALAFPALLLVCPIAMFLMMRGGGHGGSKHGADEQQHRHDVTSMSEEQLQELADRAQRELDERRGRDRASGWS